LSLHTPAALAAKKSGHGPLSLRAAIDPVGTGHRQPGSPGRQCDGTFGSQCGTQREASGGTQGSSARAVARALLWNAANPANTLAWKESEGAARALELRFNLRKVRDPKDFEGAFAMMAQQRPDVLLVLQDALTLEYRKRDHRLRVTDAASEYVCREGVGVEGGLMSYGDRFA